MDIEAVYLALFAIRRRGSEMDETHDLSCLFRDEHGSFEMGITDETVPHATAEVHGGTEHLGWEEFGIANSPGFGVRFAYRSPVNRKGCTDQWHPWIEPQRSVSVRRFGVPQCGTCRRVDKSADVRWSTAIFDRS
jgi:hypothetical protein